MTADEIVFREAVIADLPALHALVERAYRGDLARSGWTHEADLLDGPRTDAATLAAAIDSPDDILLVASVGGVFVGCVQLTRLPDKAAYLGLLTVDPHRQQDGLGKRLLAAAEAVARQRFGADRVELSVISQRTVLIAYYERRGYFRTGEMRPFPIEVEPPLKLLVLEKALPIAAVQNHFNDRHEGEE